MEETQQKMSNGMNKTFLWIVLAVVVIVGGLYLSNGKKADDANTNPDSNSTAEQTATLQPASGDVDTAIASILVEANADTQSPADTDPSLTASEDFGGLDQSLDTSGIQ